MDLSRVSDRDLIKLLDLAERAEPSKGGDVSSMSDEELLAALDESPESAAPEQPEAPELTAGRVGGLAGRAVVQAAPGAIAGLPALANDGVQQLANWGYQGIDALAGTSLADSHRQGWGGPMGTLNRLQQLGEGGADLLGLPKPETEGERIAVAGGQTALEAFGGAALARSAGKVTEGATRHLMTELAQAPKTQAAIGGVAGLGEQTAAENDVNPLLGMAGGLVAGVGTVAAGQGIRRGVQSGRQALDRGLARGDDVQRQLAAERVRGAASDPEAAYRELDEGGGGELVPGSQPTTFQGTNDMGLGGLERELQTANPGAFAERRAQQNSSRLESLRSVEGEGNSADLVGFLKGQLDEIDNATEGQVSSARSSAEAAAERFRPSDDADGLGRTLRGGMSDTEEAVRAKESALWDAVDPDGTLVVTTGGLKRAWADHYGKMTKSARAGMSAEETTLADLVEGFGNSESFRELKDFGSQAKAAMRAEYNARGRTPTWARLAQLSSAARSGMERSAATRIAEDPQVSGRFRAFVDEWQQAGSSQGIGAGNRSYGALRPGNVSGLAGETSSGSGGSGTTTRGTGLQGQPKQRKALSLTQFIAKNGGLPLDAESAARDWGNVTVKGIGKLARPDGRSVDGYWRHKLIEEGYLPPDADGYSSRDITKELYDALENERAGRKTFTAEDDMFGAGSSDDGGIDIRPASKQLREELKGVGVRDDEMSPTAFNDAAERLARGDETDAITAYERAVMDLEDEGPKRAEYAPREGKSAGSLLDGFKDDPEFAGRYRAATNATRERVGTFSKPYVAQILRKEGEKTGAYRMGDASVSRNAFMPGPTGGERIKAIVKAGGNISEITDIAAESLSKHVKDGVLDPKAYQRWKSSHEAALKELPQDVRARFASASLASQALERAATARKTALNEYNKSVLGKLAKVETADLPKTLGALLNGKDAAAQLRKIAVEARKDPAAREGLRRGVAEYIDSRFISNKEVGTSGENGIRADAFASFVKDKAPALRMVFDGPDLVRMQAIADDIKRAERSLYAVRTPGNSNTAADVMPALEKATKEAGKYSVVGQMTVAGLAGFMAGGPGGAAFGALGAWGKSFAGNVRAAGLKKVDDLVLEMMLDPQLGKIALMKQPLTNKAVQQLFSQRLARISPFAVSSASGGSNDR